MSESKKRYAQVGIGQRSWMFTDAITDRFADVCELVALCDVNQCRMDLRNRKISDRVKPVRTYKPDAFERMIAETKPDVVIVTSVDATHSDYICRAMELGCDVVTEKPMTTDEEKCRQILETIERTGRKCQVTFNYRYSPPRSQIKELLASGVIGEILSVDFAWLLDTRHGADYFRRWHRRRENSGSLLVHKSTHHFDLINWWMDDIPEEVYACGSQRYYVPATAERMGLAGRAERCRDCPVKERCKFYLDLSAHEKMRTMYLECEHEDGYFRDRCVFSDQIDIWDNMSLTVRYKSGALMSYMLHSYSPYEGYIISFNGTEGRLEHAAYENTYVSGDEAVPGELRKGNVYIRLIPAFGSPREIEVHTAKGGHGGGDVQIVQDIFGPEGSSPDPLGRKAGPRDGAMSIMVGIAAYHSIDNAAPVKISDLLGDAYELATGKNEQ